MTAVFLGALPDNFFFIFVSSIPQMTKTTILFKNLSMIGFEPWTSGVGSDHSANWATTTVLWCHSAYFEIPKSIYLGWTTLFLSIECVCLENFFAWNKHQSTLMSPKGYTLYVTVPNYTPAALNNKQNKTIFCRFDFFLKIGPNPVSLFLLIFVLFTRKIYHKL